MQTQHTAILHAYLIVDELENECQEWQACIADLHPTSSDFFSWASQDLLKELER